MELLEAAVGTGRGTAWWDKPSQPLNRWANKTMLRRQLPSLAARPPRLPPLGASNCLQPERLVQAFISHDSSFTIRIAGKKAILEAPCPSAE